MEEQCSPLSWAYYYQEEGVVDDLKQSLLYSTLELEASVISAHDEISRKDDEIIQLKGLLSKIIQERDELQAKSQQLQLQNQLLFQKAQILVDTCPISSGATSNEDASDCDDVVVAVATSPSGCKDTLPLTSLSVTEVTDRVTLKKPLPEQGKFLQAVMEAGPLLQTLLLAGPLPRWQHPPPQLNSVDIPPVTIISQESCIISPCTSGGLTNTRAMGKIDGSDFSPSSKYQKVC
ncbi:hypothetical protein CASFOL_006045 [Castilleja foliolosa]|uniref:Uncharacterized protein n=1 Tax=Castilleja foliolosa TaxID=1961234 RepID=A0ABD3E790_9LAMI